MNTIDLPESKYQVKYRVVGYPNGESCLLFSSDYYSSCEQFCWRYDGKASELHIEKVWVRK